MRLDSNLLDFSWQTLDVSLLVILIAIAGTAVQIALLYRQRIKLLEGILADRDKIDAEALHHWLETLDERTSRPLRYRYVQQKLGTAELGYFESEAKRIAGKLGLKPGYYRVDDDGRFSSVFIPESSGSSKSKKRPKIPTRKRMAILRRDEFRCQLCGATPDPDSDITLHVDHKMPLAKDGTNDDDNLWTLCNHCNLGKSDMVMEELFDDEDDDTPGGEE